MNKSELIDLIALTADIPKNAAKNVLEAVINGITSALKKDKRVTIVGFGTFSLRERGERDGHNPRTGEPMKIKAARVPSFKAGKEFKEAVQES